MTRVSDEEFIENAEIQAALGGCTERELTVFEELERVGWAVDSEITGESISTMNLPAVPPRIVLLHRTADGRYKAVQLFEGDRAVQLGAFEH